MAQDTLTLHSSIRSSLQRHLLWRGTLFGGLGIGLICYGGIWMSPEQLGSWGGLILLVGIALITLGLRPYRKVTRLLLSPYELVISPSEFCMRQSGDALFCLPFKAVRKMGYVDSPKQYGIGILVDGESDQKLQVLSSQFDMEGFVRQSRQQGGWDLFLPFFTQSSFKELDEHVFGTDD